VFGTTSTGPFRQAATLGIVGLLMLGTSACLSGGQAQGTPASTTATTSALPSHATSFVKRNAGQLTLDGQPWRFVGYNLPCANPFGLDDGALGLYLDTVQQGSGANVVRMWFFQSNGGPQNWAPFDRVVAALKSRGMRVVATLTNEFNGGCDGGAPNTRKTLEWYQGGYKQPDADHALSFRDYAAAVASHFANDPTIAIWQLVNEAEAPHADGSCDNAAGAAALRGFADDVTGAMKAVDPNHLVSLGTIGGSQCGLAGSQAYRLVHDGLVDMCEYHDYGASSSAWTAGADELAQRVDDCKNLPSGPKPLFVGESGIQGNVQPDGGPAGGCTPWPGCTNVDLSNDTLSRRAAFFDAKMRAALDHGVAGYLIWVKSPYYNPSDDMFAIGDNDPTELAVKALFLPGAPTITSVSPCTGGAVVTWSAPSSAGYATLEGYTVTASDGTSVTTGPQTTTAVVTGLHNDSEYTFTVNARTSEGPGAVSEPSAAVETTNGHGKCPPR
jgi:hypothetical protein